MKKILMMMAVALVFTIIFSNNIYSRGTHSQHPGNWTASNGKSSQDGDAVNVTPSNGGNTITLRCMPSSMCCFIISNGMLDINPPLGAQNEAPADPMGTTILTRGSTIENINLEQKEK